LELVRDGFECLGTAVAGCQDRKIHLTTILVRGA
jgi:hypothetical protein